MGTVAKTASTAELAGATLAESAREWPRLLQQLLTQLDTTHADWTRARKLGAVRHVLTSSTDNDRTREKLERLMGGWAGRSQDLPGLQVVRPPAAADGDELLGSDANFAAVNRAAPAGRTVGSANLGSDPKNSGASEAAQPKTDANSAASNPWRTFALAALELYEPVPRADTADRRVPRTELAEESLGRRVGRLAVAPDETWLSAVKTACKEGRNDARRQVILRERLINLLRLVCANLALFAEDDEWVSGQVMRVTALLQAPLDEGSLSDVEDSLQCAVRRQSELKADLNLARMAVKEMLSSLVARLGAAAAHTGEFHRRIGERAEAIGRADNLVSITRVVASLLADAAEMREQMERTHDELNAARKIAEESSQRIITLEGELTVVSGLVRVDPLTQVLNRRGLEEAFAVQKSTAERGNQPLAVALLDIDDFKKLNDTLGHHAGDLALKHVTDLVHGTLRPCDTVARFGGEEFVILLKATDSAGAATVMKRLQRQLTRAIFLHNDAKTLITFSVGITSLVPGENWDAVISRADAALYAAKAAGKNCVRVM